MTGPRAELKRSAQMESGEPGTQVVKLISLRRQIISCTWPENYDEGSADDTGEE